MLHTLYKKPMTDAETARDDEKLTTYLRLSRVGVNHFVKRLFSLMQRQIRVLQFVALLTIICVTLLILAQNSTKSSHTETNIEPITRGEQISPKYASVARAESEIIPRVIMSRDEMEDVRRELNARKRRLLSVCETIHSKRSYLDAALTNMIIDTEHNVSWCPIYKVASSTWMSYFAVLKGILTDTVMDLVRHNLLQLSEIVRQKFIHDEDLNTMHVKVMKTKKFLIVRHPLERLLSAYRDKLEHMKGREYYYKRFGRRIAFKYRLPGNETKLEPTFEEFLRFIVNEKFFDEHWTPYYQTCEPCAVRYDYILKFETLDRDENFFIQDANLSEHLYEKNYVRNMNPYGTTTREILSEYIKKIPRSLLEEIYKIYENDYKLFDYSFV
ncbi:carbohydrate sulfotransferase 11-like [Odontomachus brunneus]|uniref:carbohydrate sulfotransferase 11-like n=1 Tax=Odontomachus brunneus TaxID=486640 RepID=UPI0013F20B12|nr:carbohydrate sulfotransferase 11-like [Odontomachus brunneus]XP_032678229.1 carbohydrate sulfotransferase 11-like [Odontomachus brunneus]